MNHNLNRNHNDPFLDTTWASPPSRRPESIRLDSHIGGGGIDFEDMSDSNSSDIFGQDTYEYKVSSHDYHNNQQYQDYNNKYHNDIDIQTRNTRIVPLRSPDFETYDNTNIGETVEHNGRTIRYVNVNDLINKIGFGKFHYQLIFLCGLGYIVDNMWGEAISLIIAPVQNEFKISNAYIGWLASVLYFGMCCGSFFWGRLSDIVGRKFPFTLTLTIGGISGMICSFMGSFGWLLLSLFCLGFGVGGNIPVDGAILAEFLPMSHRGRIMVSLSVFWALGDLLASWIAWLIVPNNICSTNGDGEINYDCKKSDNMGWRYFVFLLGLLNCAFLLFRLGTNESPNFLITQGEGGRRRALNVLKSIAKINKLPQNTVTDDMILTVDNPMVNRSLVQRLKKQQRISQNLHYQNRNNNNQNNIHAMYHEQLNSNLNQFENNNNNNHNNNQNNNENNNENNNNLQVDIDLKLDLETNQMSFSEITSELFSSHNKERNLLRATPLIWIAWFGSSFGVTLFSTFLPKFLEAKNIHLSSIYGDALIFAFAALPGPFVGAYLVEVKALGRRYTMTLAGIIISLLLFMFIFAQSETPLVILACLVEFFIQIFYAGLMCYTPEAYPTDIRTTASGIATGIRHMANILGPIIAGKTFGNSGDTPLVLATVSVLIAGISTAFLPFDTATKRLVPTLSL